MEKILLVEDNAQIMEINSEFLTDCGYDIYKACSVEECRTQLKSLSPDLIVMDIMLPDGDGFSLCDEIRMESRVPILFLSAKNTNADIVSGLRRGGDDYLTKPYDLLVFQAKVEALLRRSSESPKDYHFRYGALEFDPHVTMAYCNGEALNLTQKEFALLLYLAKNRGKVVSKEELYSVVWGQELLADGNALWTAMSRLKKKVESYEAFFCIDANRSGYALYMERHAE